MTEYDLIFEATPKRPLSGTWAISLSWFARFLAKTGGLRVILDFPPVGTSRSLDLSTSEIPSTLGLMLPYPRRDRTFVQHPPA
jgi:hypothetical protein